MLEWCRRCRNFKEKEDFPNKKGVVQYCSSCRKGANLPNWFNRYISSKRFIDLSFNDVVGNTWPGFKQVEYFSGLSEKISEHIDIKFVGSFVSNLTPKPALKSSKVIYLCSVDTNLLKVGQTTNWESRFIHYHSFGKHVKYDMFVAKSWADMDLKEVMIRNYLEYLGYVLPKDGSDCRMKYIKL